jgi:hypothetical protein
MERAFYPIGGGNVSWFIHHESQYGGSSKNNENRSSQAYIPLLGIYPKTIK